MRRLQHEHRHRHGAADHRDGERRHADQRGVARIDDVITDRQGQAAGEQVTDQRPEEQ